MPLTTWARARAALQAEHVLSEKAILLACKHPFLPQLHATFADADHIYLLLDLCHVRAV